MMATTENLDRILLTIVFLVGNTLVEGRVEREVQSQPAAVVAQTLCEISSDPEQVRPSQCCKVGDILPPMFKEEFKECEKIYPFVYQIPNGYDEDPWTLWVHHTSCLDECIFSGLGVLTEDKKIDQDELRDYFTQGIVEPVLTALHNALDNCFAIYQYELTDDNANNDLVCRSGATELLGCYMREVFLNCPDDLWTATAKKACGSLWDKVNDCPKIHVMLHKPSLAQTKPTEMVPAEDSEE